MNFAAADKYQRRLFAGLSFAVVAYKHIIR